MTKNIIITGASSSIGILLVNKLMQLPVKLFCHIMQQLIHIQMII